MRELRHGPHRPRHLAHAYSANAAGRRGLCAEADDHVWEHGGAYALLGPSGCGKTTLLNIISGLVTPVARAGSCSTARTSRACRPQERNIAQVFQFPVIYDTMTVGENLAFPLRNRGVPPAEIDAARRARSPTCSTSTPHA